MLLGNVWGYNTNSTVTDLSGTSFQLPSHHLYLSKGAFPSLENNLLIPGTYLLQHSYFLQIQKAVHSCSISVVTKIIL
jgi:hypothetical protein